MNFHFLPFPLKKWGGGRGIGKSAKLGGAEKKEKFPSKVGELS